MYRLAAAFFLAVASFLPPAFGAWADETRALERRVATDPRKVIQEGSAALAKAETAADKRAQLHALRLLAMAYDNLDDNPGLRAAARKGVALAVELGETAAQVELMNADAMSAFNEGRIEEALRRNAGAVALAQANGLERDLGKAYLNRAHMLVGQERSSEAMEMLLRAQALFEKLGEKLLMSTTLSAVGNILTTEDAPREQLLRAVDYHRRAMALVDPKAKYELSTIYYNLGVAYSYLKDYGEAFHALEKCLAIGREIDDPHTLAYVNYRMGSIELDRGRPDQAIVRFDFALPGFRAAENVQLEMLTHLGRAKALAALKRRRESLAALEAAQPLVVRIDSPGRDVRFHEAAAEVHAQLGDWEAAWRDMRALREAEHRAAKSANLKLSQELQARFGARQRETENELLRVEGKMQEARRFVLLLALALTGLIALALIAYLVRQARASRRFAALAMRDDLTGLPNRRSILEYAKAQFRGRRSSDAAFVLALIDLDHFKGINDELGHSTGDAVLRAFAEAGQRVMRIEDRLGRFGGEEFVLIMPGVDVAQVPAVFDRMRKAVGEMRAPGYPEGRTLTFSMGATAARPADPDLDHVIKRADEALYRAKNNGRDRYEIA